MRYDPDVAPSAAQWLALDEAERMAVVERSHDATTPNLPLHIAIHAAVETQIAMNLPSVVDTVARLQAQGLNRHDTIHAIGAVLAGHMWEMLRADPAAGDPNADYFAALDQLSAESWRRDYGSPLGAG
jgi:uncharacterized protein DUF1841